MAESNQNGVHLSFTIGPVQAFVAQARRTRDLWAGSWLLSYLAETALAAAERAGGNAIIPYRDDGKRRQVTSTGSPIGGYPNRFELSFDTIDNAKQAAKLAEAAFHEAWKKIAAAVWTRYVSPAIEEGKNTKEIWDRQVGNFWEITWVIGTPSDGARTISQLAAARKNIRNVQANPEPGIKCSLMGTLQELSGHYGREARIRQEAFWGKLQQGISGLDIKPGERLCAIALIKRLFPHVIKQAVGDGVCEELTQQKSWPSTAFLAALPWLKRVAEREACEAQECAESAIAAGWENGEHQAATDSGLQANWAWIDGSAWFASTVRKNEPDADKKSVESLLEKLNLLYDKMESKPIPYYALLLMDGDSMGRLVAMLDSPQKVSEGLNRFAEAVGGIVEEHWGRTVYAGGDDVLAILPAEQAFEVASELAGKYQACFQSTKNERPISEATLSGAIVYAHLKFPLRQVLQTAHHLLDDIAKEKTGRDSIAIGVIQGSGLQAVWSVPWSVVRCKEKGPELLSFIDEFESDPEETTTKFNASFLYQLREQFSKLFTEPIEFPGKFGKINFDNDLLVDIANSEYQRRVKKAEQKQMPPDKTREKVQKLIALSQSWTRNETTRKVTCDSDSFSFDGWRVARFLKQVKDGKMEDHE